MTPEEIKQTIKDAVHDELGHYKVDKELHYKHHIFLGEFMEWYGDIKSTFWKTLVKYFVSGIVFLLLLGFIVWGHSK